MKLWERSGIHFRKNLIDSGAFIQDREDELIWTRGDNSGLITVKNIYQAILSTQGLQKIRDGGKLSGNGTFNSRLSVFSG
jgi:hypothetical protein